MQRKTSYFDQTCNEFISAITRKTECSEQSHRALKFKSHFAAGALGDGIRFGIFVVYI
jgi:hypothetical protein